MGFYFLISGARQEEPAVVTDLPSSRELIIPLVSSVRRMLFRGKLVSFHESGSQKHVLSLKESRHHDTPGCYKV